MTKAIRVLIADDESLARDTIRILLEDVKDFEIVGEAADGLETVELIASLSPDLVFLDVQMPGCTGLEVIGHVGVSAMPTVVFVTAYDQYAVKAFDASAVDYLVKPFSDERFETALERVRTLVQQKERADLEGRLTSLLQNTETPTVPSGQSRFIIRDRNAIRFVETTEIDWVEAAGDYVILHTGDKEHMIRDTMVSVEKRLDNREFVRIHRSNIVRISSIRELKPHFHGDYMLYMKDGTELKLSRRYWANVESVLDS